MKMNFFLILTIFCILFNAGFWLNSDAQTGSKLKFHRVGQHSSQMDTMERHGVLMGYPTNFFASTLKVSYEFRLTPNKGLKLFASYGASSDSGNLIYPGLNKFNELGFEAQFRFYVSKVHMPLSGLYLAPYASYKKMTYSGYENYNALNALVGTSQTYITNATTSNLSVGYIIGYQMIFNSSFTIDGFIGGGDNFISGNNSGSSLSSALFAYRTGIDLHMGIGIGVAF